MRAPTPDPEAVDRPGRRELVTWLAIGLFAIMGLALTLGSRIPSPYVVLTTAPLHSATELVTPRGSAGSPSARTGITYANLANRQLRWSELPVWYLRRSPSTELIRADGMFGKGLQGSTKADFEQGIRQGMLVAWRLAGRPAPASAAGITVLHAANGTDLQPGDVILRAEGIRLRNLEDLLPILQRHRPGDRIAVTRANGKQGSLWLYPEPTRKRGWTLSAVLGEPMSWSNHPVRREIALGQLRGEGSSNGLASVLRAYEILTRSDLARGRKIVASGHVDALGDVDSVLGLPQKARAAADAGADLMIVSNADVREAGRALTPSDRLQVVGVDSAAEAITLLKRLTPAEACGTCGA